MTDYKNLKLIATSSPHIRAAENTRSIMLDVIIAMMPALIWAIENITKGTTSTTFSPNADCTRAQIVTFLWRCKK